MTSCVMLVLYLCYVVYCAFSYVTCFSLRRWIRSYHLLIQSQNTVDLDLAELEVKILTSSQLSSTLRPNSTSVKSGGQLVESGDTPG